MDLRVLNGTLPLPIDVPLLAVDRAYILISDLFALFSFCGCLIIIICYITYPGIRTTSRLLLLFLSLANILLYAGSFGQTMSYYRTPYLPDERSFICQTTAALLVYSQVSTALWTVMITFYLFLCVSARCITVANRLVVLFHIFCWTMPLIVSLSADLSGVYGYDSTDLFMYQHPTTCWLSDRVSNSLPWYLITVEGWVMAAFVIGSLLYFPILWTSLKQKPVDRDVVGDDVIEQLSIDTANKQLRFIPVIYVCTRIWGTGYFLFTRYPDNRHLRGYDWLLIIKAIGDNSQGLINAIFFCLATKQIRKLIARKFACFCGWCGEHRIIGGERWMRVPHIVKARHTLPRRRTMDGSDLDITGISLDIPINVTNADLGNGEEDHVLFEQ